MEEYKPKKASPESSGSGGPARPRVPVKGDSTPSDVPREEEGATFVGGPSTSPIDSNAAASDVTYLDPSPTPAAGKPRLSNIFPKQNQLQTGDVLGGRFEILDVLGEGGMGTVYKALDREVDHLVALKLIRPEMAAHPAILARFKQELLTARQVTHRNVIRIYDLSEVDGVKFITMEFVEGHDLRKLLLDQGKLSAERAVDIIRQVCLALEAAHSAGVIHRDLKPQNVMQDKQGRILVMDFGLARSLASEGMTQTGALMGTIEYMSPEQAMGKHLDGRSDLFAVGLIFYELLTCKLPFRAETAVASLLKRNQERALPAAELDVTIPKGLSDIVSKCLERDLNLRYQSAQEILADLDAWQGKRPISASVVIPPPAPPRVVPWKWIAVAAVALLLLVGTPIVLQRFTHKTPTQHAPVSVLVGDFTNHTGDPGFDGTLEPMFNVALEGASFISAYNRGSARKLARKLPNPTDKLDEQPARLVALSQGISTVIAGEISRRGNSYSVSAIALDAATGNVLVKAEATSTNKDEVVGTIPKLVAPIRKALGDATPESVQLAASGPFTAASLEVVHMYSVAMEQQFAGKTEEALRSFSKAVDLDPNFARAYSGMSATSGGLGRQVDGEKYVKLAMEHLDRMTERERYHTRAFFYFMTGDYPKCVEEYSTLVNQYPADRIGQANLAACFAQMRNIPKAVEAARRAVEIVPSAVVQRLNLSFLSSFGGDFQNGEREARAALQINPSSEAGYLILAEAQMGQGQLSEAVESYHKLEKVSARGASMSAAGLADLAVYEGRFTGAVRLLEQAASADLEAKRPENAADKFATLAHTQLLRDQRRAAVAAADKALAYSQSVQVRFLTGQIFAESGETAKAQKLATGLGKELQSEPQAYAKIIDGMSALRRGDPRQAVKTVNEANKLLDTWIGRFELGRAYLEAGLYVEADSEFDRCIKRRGEALELFLDNVPTYGYFPLVYYYQGRAREGLKSAGFAESYRTYLGIRGQAGEDPLLPEIRRRLGQ
jgi:serine/threonine protein kinase/tetratricopeptide (TPR) repeat protein